MLGLLAYHKGLALRDVGQLVQARDAFAEAVKLIPDQAEGLDALCVKALCRKDRNSHLLDQAKNLLAGLIPQDHAKGQQLLNDGLQMRREAIAAFGKPSIVSRTNCPSRSGVPNAVRNSLALP